MIEEANVTGADRLIFGCTESCMILDADTTPLPGFDNTNIHVAAAVDFALSASR